jgi:menaquinone-dependent protoporphyrinogen IX oxidase
MNSRNKKVLLAYDSKYGYVKDIVDSISKKLGESNLEPQIVDIARVKKKNWPIIEDYDGIIIGANAGKYKALPNKILAFMKSNLNSLNPSRIPLGIFKSDPWQLEILKDPEKIRRKFEKSLMRHFGFLPTLYKVFCPVLDFSRKSKIDRDDRKYLKPIAKKISKKTGLEFDYKGLNDFRDWQNIENFAQNFSELINSNYCPQCGTQINSNTQFCENCGAKLNQ